MIRKWDRNELMPCQPAIDAAQNKGILQVGARRRCRVRHRFVAVSLIEGPQPWRRVEERTARMSLQEGFPTAIFQRLDFVDCQNALGFLKGSMFGRTDIERSTFLVGIFRSV